MRSATYPLLGILLISTPLAHAAKLYKWVDEEGNTHFSQRPPNDVGSQPVIIHEQTEEPAPEDVAPTPLPVPTADAASQALAIKCQGLMDNLEIYTSQEKIIDSEGNSIIISEELREAKIDEINQQLDQFCR